jgi:hypothetical protein
MSKLRFDKDLFEAGSQCAKRLYLEVHQPKSKPPLSEERQLLVDVGRQLIDLASQAFPGGQRIEGKNDADAVKKTTEFLAANERGVLLDAAFGDDDAVTRTDILLLEGKSADDGVVEVSLFEVKAGTTIKPRHLNDLALQMLVIENNGLRVKAATILHLDARYKHPGGSKYSIKLFKSNDVTERVRRQVDRVVERLRSFRALVDDSASLELPTGTWCKRPLPCPFLDRCLAEGPSHPLIELPRLTREQEFRLHEQAIESIDAIKDRPIRLSAQQRRAIKAVRKDEPVIEDFVPGELTDVDWPLYFLDILWCVEVLPRFAKTKPWEQIPFQWSIQILHEDGRTERRCYTATTADDPREEVVRRLVWSVREAGTLVVWDSPHEERLRAFLDDLPKLKAELRVLLNMPVFDLCHLIQHGVYAPGFGGSYDLHAVHDAMIEDHGREDLEIADPEAAAQAYRRLLNSRTRSQTRDKLGAQLEEYGNWRTAAMMRLYDSLRTQPATKV